MSDPRTFDVDGVPTTTASDLADDAVVVDVREDDEWAAGHIATALHIPMGQVPQRLEELPEGPFNVVCRSGGRSRRTVEWLQRNGYDAVNVDGGMGAWAEAGRPMVSDSGQEPFVR
ncbi:rhodanese-like domain-containing protein [Kineococcus rhizosphaerae]|uniref:Rhodanese-related sulfurtransferase n=1 Tax=Kineococcus rhizosphaerae TaxID=559628 RepID=A0A2T0QWU4_9ACTN|nr:rhodanese-like domain-containing protein [Kineococcus rhizosphaerae]PRY10038.1 rhodanese-related sulfurtransferase [Kineococcus rhizosphaerae]